jgi:hypothetical protein
VFILKFYTVNFTGKFMKVSGFKPETSPVPPTLKLPDAAGWCPDIF